jgi:hypothetical protein
MQTALIRIDERDGGGYPISLSVDDGATRWNPRLEARALFNLPEEPPAGDAGAQAAGEAARRLVLDQGDDSPDFKAAGGRLYDALTGNAAGAAWSRARAAAGAGGLRTLLDIVPDDLAALPWELLWDPADPMGAFASTTSPIVRVRGFNAEAHEPEDWWPLLRVLVIVALDDEKAAEELAGLHDGFAAVCGLVDLDVLRRPSWNDLKEHFEHRPHVVHYIGHGQPGQLDFPPPDGEQNGWRWDTASIAGLLERWKPRLVVLNACRSQVSTFSLDDQGGVFGVAETFSKKGVPAVVAMQADVRDDAAGAFSVELWRQVGNGVDVDKAVAYARDEMANTVGGWARRDPFLPALTMSVAPENVLPRLYPLNPNRREILQRTPSWDTVHHFVDRGDQRRQIWSDVMEIANGSRREGILLRGQSQIGKSALARWCVGAAALRGHEAVYVDLDRRPADGLGILSSIAEQLSFAAGDDPRVTAPLDAFIARVDELQGDQPSVHPVPVAEGRYRRVLKGVALETIDTIYDAFRQALRTIAGDGRLLIALDHVPVHANVYWTYFRQYFLSRLADARTVCIVTAGDDLEASLTLGPDLVRQYRSVEVTQLKRVELCELAGQLLRAYGFRRKDFHEFVVGYVRAVPETLEGVGGSWVDGLVALANQAYTRDPGSP